MLTHIGIKTRASIETRANQFNQYTAKDFSGNDVTVYSISGDKSCEGYFKNHDYFAPAMGALSNLTTYFYGSDSTTSSYYNFAGVVMGDGDTAPTIDDYTLSGNVITNFWAATSIKADISNGEDIKGVAVYIIQNIGSSSFTIKEVGITRSNLYNNATARVLVARDLLATPLTLAPAELGVIKYTMVIKGGM